MKPAIHWPAFARGRALDTERAACGQDVTEAGLTVAPEAVTCGRCRKHRDVRDGLARLEAIQARTLAGTRT